MSNGTNEEIMEFIERIHEVGGIITTNAQGMTIQLYSQRSIGDLIHKLDSLYHKRFRKNRSHPDFDK
jgi:hypothetical protein